MFYIFFIYTRNNTHTSKLFIYLKQLNLIQKLTGKRKNIFRQILILISFLFYSRDLIWYQSLCLTTFMNSLDNLS